MLVQPAQQVYRTWIVDSRRWEHYRARADDIIIATHPKSGTTWTQRIVGLFVLQSPEPFPIKQVSPWIDRRFPQPLDSVLAQIEAQDHRRFVEAHLPLDGLPFYEEVRYIHVARDGRDVCISYHNHCSAFTDDMLSALDKAGLEDQAVGRPYPRTPADPADFFHRSLTEGVVPDHEDGSPTMSFFHLERTWWDARHCPNVLLVHYNDLKADLSGEMRRIADFLDISVAPKLWPDLVKAAGFEAMRRDGDKLMPTATVSFQGGSQRFLFKGTNERWRGVFREEDLTLYDAKVEAKLSPSCAQWLASGRSSVGDPRLAAA